jgi:hypothetical protein
VLDAVDRPARWARLAAAAIAVVGTIVVLALVLTDEPPALTAKTLVPSLEDAVGSAPVATGECHLRQPRRWSCLVSDREGSGGGTYAVRATSDHCWEARLTSDPAAAETPMPRTASACLH